MNIQKLGEAPALDSGTRDTQLHGEGEYGQPDPNNRQRHSRENQRDQHYEPEHSLEGKLDSKKSVANANRKMESPCHRAVLSE